jgi:hypothetical protein
LTVSSSRITRSGVELDGVSMLHGRIQASKIVVANAGRRSHVDGLVVDGVMRDAHQNSLYSLDGSAYLVVLQKAVVPGKGSRRVGTVGLRLTIGPGWPGIPAGTEVLAGLADRGSEAAPSSRPNAWAVLGFDTLVRTGVGLPSVAEPLLGTPSSSPVVAIAEQYLGIPYVWGGADPATGFDCSGLTMYVYAQLGIPLTHFAAAQFHEGARVPRDELRPGDLVFFEPGRLGPGHVGIYVGNGAFIQAPHTGDVVRISSLDDPHYAFSYVGAVRPGV